MNRKTTFVIAVFLAGVAHAQNEAAASAARPADQTYVLKAPPRLAPIPAPLTDAFKPEDLTEGQLTTLIANALGAWNEKPVDEVYYVLHLVHHPEQLVGSIRDSWYVYFKGFISPGRRYKLNTPHWEDHYKRARLFGARKVSLIYVHYNVPAGELPKQANGNPADPAVVAGPTGEPVTQLPGSTSYIEKTFLPITYSIDISKKTPIIVDNLKAVLGAFGLTGGAPGTRLESITSMALIGVHLNMQLDYPVSNIAIAGQRGEGRSNIGSKTFDNERKYALDFGFAIPLTKIKELKLSDTNILIPRPVERANIYGTVSFFPLGPVDTKAEKAWRAPQVIYGMALSNKPWDNHLFAVGFMTKYVQPFVGLTLVNKQVRTPTDSDPGLKWSTRLAYGIHVPASTISNFIKSAGK